jgi:hypothetical protein
VEVLLQAEPRFFLEKEDPSEEKQMIGFFVGSLFESTPVVALWRSTGKAQN